MKKLLVLLFVLLAVPAMAVQHEVEFSWNANTEPDVAEYVLHQSSTSGGPYTPILTIPHPQTSTPYVVSGSYNQKFYFVLTAVDNSDNESGYSNQVSYTLPAPPDTQPPAPPTGLRATLLRIIQAIMDWFRGGLRVG